MLIREKRARKRPVVNLEVVRNILYAAVFPMIVIALLLIKMPEGALVSPYLSGKLPIIAGIVAMGGFLGIFVALGFVTMKAKAGSGSRIFRMFRSKSFSGILSSCRLPRKNS